MTTVVAREGSRAVNAGGPLLKELRQGRGWSQQDEAQLLKQLARRFGFHHIAGTKTRSVVREIQRWEAGEHAPDERYQLLWPMPTRPVTGALPSSQSLTSTG